MSATPVHSLSPTFGRRRLLLATMALPALAAVLAACGDNTQDSGANPPTTSPNSTTTTVLAGAIEHPTAADQVIVRLSYVGGLVPFGVAFQNVPSLLIAGDGRVYTPGVSTAIFPGPLVPAMNVRTIDEAGIQRVLALSADAGLLAQPPDYAADLNIADAPVTQLVLNAGGGTFTHQAYALGLQDPAETKDRNVLNGVVIQLGDLEQLVGSEHLTPDAPLVPGSYRVQARPLTIEQLDSFIDPVPTVVPWPDAIGTSLAEATTCAIVPAASLGTLFSDASERTFFSEGDGEAATVYQLTVVALLPADIC